MFAIAKIGAVKVPINTRFRTDDAKYVIDQAECTTLITHDTSGPIDYWEMVRELVPDGERHPDGAIASSVFPALKRIVIKTTEADAPAPEGTHALHDVMAAAAMGATAFQKGLGAIHALSHPVGALFDTHHGMTNAVVMPAVLAFNRASIETKIDRLAAFLGIDGGFEGFFDFVLQLRSNLSVPRTLGDLGVTADAIPTMAKMAPDDPTAGGNPVTLTETAARELFEQLV